MSRAGLTSRLSGLMGRLQAFCQDLRVRRAISARFGQFVAEQEQEKEAQGANWK